MTSDTKKGFTLIELLIVIGILAILVAAVVVVLNPAQLLAQARDGQRMSDLDAAKSAIQLYLSMESGTLSTAGPFVTVAGMTVSSSPTNWTTATTTSSTAVDGTGWIPVDFSGMAGGSPLARLPIDPTNSGEFGYGYVANTSAGTFKLIGRLESTKYQPKMATDGGNLSTCSTYTAATCWYEVGTDVSGL